MDLFLPFSSRDGSRQGTAINHRHMVVWSLIWSCVMVLSTFELANLLVLSYSQGARALTGMAAGFYRGQNKTQLLWRRLPVTLPLYVRICVYKILSMAIWAVASIAWHNYFRLGELISSKSITFHASRHVHRGCRMSRVAWESVKWSRMDEPVYSFHQDQEVLW